MLPSSLTPALSSLILLAAAGTTFAALQDNPGVPAAEKGTLSEVYRLEVPDASAGWNTVAIPYSIDNAAITLSGYTRVAYYLQLGNVGNEFAQYVYASFDVIPDLDTAIELGVPSLGPNGSGKVIKANVSNLRVFAGGAAGVTIGDFPTGGNLEFWPSNYGAGANGRFDFNDDGFGNTNGHASMQIHNGGLAQTLIGYSAWGGARPSELGVGVGPNPSGNSSGTQPDWTFNTTNDDNFTIQTLQVFVQPIPEPASVGLAMLGGAGLLALRRRRTV